MVAHTKDELYELRVCGERVLSALREKRGLDYDDIQLLPQITDVSNKQAGRIVVGYVGSIFTITMLGALLGWIFATDVRDYSVSIVLVVFLTMMVHGCWSMTGGRDYYYLEISRLLRCQSCKRNISGNMIHYLVESSHCPHCGVSIEIAINCSPNA